jgi:hypothetical protein
MFIRVMSPRYYKLPTSSDLSAVRYVVDEKRKGEREIERMEWNETIFTYKYIRLDYAQNFTYFRKLLSQFSFNVWIITYSI